MAWRCNSKISPNPMSSQRRTCVKVALFLGVVGFVGLGSSLRAQNAPSPEVETSTADSVVQRNIEDWVIQGRGVPDDWTHHHLVFSDPGTEKQAIENGTFERWLEVSKDPRFTLSQVKRSRGAKALLGQEVSEAVGPDRRIGVPVRPVIRPEATVRKDWNVPIGGVAASGTGTVTTNSAVGTSTVTVDGQVLTASAPTTASATGTFTGLPGAGQGVTVTNGSNALNLTTSATTATAIGTVSAAPTSTVAPTITLTNSAGSSANTLTLTNNGTGATATGTFSGTGPSNGQTITIQAGSNTLTLSLSGSAGTPGTGTITVSNTIGAANGDTLTIGNVVYTFEESTSAFSGSQFTGSQYYCQNTTSPCVWWGTTAANTAQAIYAAITNNPAACPSVAGANGGNSVWQYGCYSYITAPNPSVTATVTTTTTPTNTGVISLTNISGTSAPFLTSSTQGAFTLTATAGTIPSGSNACTSPTAGTVSPNSTPATMASYLAAAINSCENSYPAVGVTASVNGGAVTITDTTPGSDATDFAAGGTASNFAWGSVTAGSAGTNGCTSATTGTFATGSTTAAVASNIAAAINSCNSSYPAVGVVANYTSGNTFTVSNPAAGPFLTESGSNLSGLFSWGSVVTGTAGTNTCTSSTSGTFAASNSTTTLASNLATAIAACPAAAGISASSSGSAVTITARSAGPAGNNIAIAEGLSNFTWSGSNLSGGSDGTTTGTTFAYSSAGAMVSTAQLATNIATAINANSTLSTVVSATPVGSQVIVTALAPGTAGNSYGSTASLPGFAWSGATLTGGLDGATVEPNMSPAKYSFGIVNASCSDFVVYPTGTAGATHGASIAAFSNLYTGGCTGTVPSPLWAYNTGGMATTSPVLSLDGTQVVFVQVSGTTASLVLLKWADDGGTISMPVTLSNQTAASYPSCTAPCMLTLPFSGSHTDTFSAPYYDYLNDVVYVGDDSGYLHKFTGVLNGTPAEVTATWPVRLSTTSKLSSPVYDGTTYVIVGDFGGVLHSVTAATGAVHGTTASVGDVIADAPLVDGNAGEVYAFVTTGNTAYQHNKNFVFEVPTNFTSISAPTAAVFEPLGAGATGYYLYAGTFDNVYYSSAAYTGNLYVVGNTSTTGGATLYRIPITASVMGTPVSAVTGLNSTLRPFPSPVTEFCNNGASACTANTTQTTAGTDYIFFSVNRGAVSGCTNATGNGCILSYNVTNPSTISLSGSGLNVTTPGTNGCWATGGIVVDNSVPTGTLAGASQTYFIGLGSNAAGGPALGTKASTNCTAGTAGTIAATQTSQSNP